MITKKHVLYWVFDFLAREYPAVLKDLLKRTEGDKEEPWVNKSLAERYAAYKEVGPAGYKYLGEFVKDGQVTYRDLVVAHPDKKLADAEVETVLSGASKVSMIILSASDLEALKLQPGQVRTPEGIRQINAK